MKNGGEIDKRNPLKQATNGNGLLTSILQARSEIN